MASSRAEEANHYGKYDRKGPKPEQLGRKAVPKNEEQNAPRRSPKKRKNPFDKDARWGGSEKTPKKPQQKLPEGGLRHVGGAGSGPANFAGSAIPTPTPSPGPPLNDLAASPPRPDNFTPPTPAPAPFVPQVPPNANMSQASILNTVPPELRAPPPAPYMYPTPPSNSMAGTETAPHAMSLGNSMAGQETAPRPGLPGPLDQMGGQWHPFDPSQTMAQAPANPFGGQDPKDILALLLQQAGGGDGGAAPNQPQTGALGFPIPRFPGFGG